ncbi:TPA: hypothetical protein ACK3RG_008770, partial [Burkholderia cepacia]
MTEPTLSLDVLRANGGADRAQWRLARRVDHAMNAEVTGTYFFDPTTGGDGHGSRSEWQDR